MLVARIENDNGRVVEGGRMTLKCEGRGYPEPTLTWEKLGRPLTTNGNVFISSDGRLVIRDATLDDTGTYSCIVANSEEKIETSTSVQIVPKGNVCPVVRKPVFRVFDQVPHKPGCTTAQDG